MELSVVVPVCNEEDNILPMLDALENALNPITHEIIFVDDGSKDRTVDRIHEAALGKPHIRTIVFTRNFGQTSAMAAGIDAATGTYIATLDGDLQNDPADIPMMLDTLKQKGLDIVAGIRAKRQDNAFLRKIPSKIANALIRYFTQVHISDYGCTLKLFRQDMAKKLDLYGELHRFIPVLAEMEGANIAEVTVKHHPRKFGQAKYGLGRTFKVLSDLMLMVFLLKYRQKPMHFFGGMGAAMMGSGGLIELYLLLLKLLGHPIAGRPLFYVGILLITAGLQLITTGFIAEVMMRTYYGSQQKKPYNIRATYRGGKEA